MRFDNVFPITHRVFIVTTVTLEGESSVLQGWAIAGAYGTVGGASADTTFYLVVDPGKRSPEWVSEHDVESSRIEK